MATVFHTGFQPGIYELFISQRVCELVFMHHILRSRTTNSGVHALTPVAVLQNSC